MVSYSSFVSSAFSKQSPPTVAVSAKQSRHADEYFSAKENCWMLRSKKSNKKPKKVSFTPEVIEHEARKRPIPAPRHSLKRFDFGPTWTDSVYDVPDFPKNAQGGIECFPLAPFKDNCGVTFGDNFVTKLVNKINKREHLALENAQANIVFDEISWIPPVRTSEVDAATLPTHMEVGVASGEACDPDSSGCLRLDGTFECYVGIDGSCEHRFCQLGIDSFSFKERDIKTTKMEVTPEVCYYHANRGVFIACPSCGVALCHHCADITSLQHSGPYHFGVGQNDTDAASYYEERQNGLKGGETDKERHVRLERARRDYVERNFLACHLPFFTEKKIEVTRKAPRANIHRGIDLSNKFDCLLVMKTPNLKYDYDDVGVYKEPEYLQKFPTQQVYPTDRKEFEISRTYFGDEYVSNEYYVTESGRYYETSAVARCPSAHYESFWNWYWTMTRANRDRAAPWMSIDNLPSPLESNKLFNWQRNMRTWGKNRRRRAARAVKRSENAMLQYYIDENNKLYEEIAFLRDGDLNGVDGRKPYIRRCRVRTCNREAMTHCYDCELHCKCFHHRRRGPRSSQFLFQRNCRHFNAQSLFGVDVNVKFPFLDSIADNLATLSKDKDFWLQFLSTVVIQGMQVFHNPTKTAMTLAVTQIIVSLPITRTLTSSLIESVMKLLSWATTPTNVQNNSNDLDKVCKLIYAGLMGIGILIPAIMVSKLPNSSDVTNFINRFSKVGSCVKSFETISDIIKPTVDMISDYIRVKFFDLEPQTVDSWRDIDAWCDEVVALHTTDFEKNIVRSNALKETVESLLIRGDKILKLLDSLRIPASQRSRVSALMLFLHRARGMIAHSGAGYTEPRRAPIIIHLYGDTGVGKSSALSMLCSKILVAMGCTNPNDLFEKVYFRDATQEFWDGFNEGARIVVVDDIGQVKDQAGVKNPEPLEQIRMSNTAPYAPHMAHLENKGTTNFRADVLIWTSNKPVINFESLSYPDAVGRRVHLKFHQVPARDYQIVRTINGRTHVCLDSDRAYRESIEDPMVYTRALVYKPMDPQGSTYINDPDFTISFNEMAQQCIEKHRYEKEKGDHFNEFQKQFFRDCVNNAQSGLNHDSGRRVHTFWEPNAFRRALGTKVHLDIERSLYGYLPNTVNDVDISVSEGEQTSGFRKAVCVALNTRVVKSFLQTFVTAMFFAETHGKTEYEKDVLFDRVLFRTGEYQRGVTMLCTEHGKGVSGFFQKWYNSVLESVVSRVYRFDDYHNMQYEEARQTFNSMVPEPRPFEYTKLVYWTEKVFTFIQMAIPMLILSLSAKWFVEKVISFVKSFVNTEGYGGDAKGRQSTNMECSSCLYQAPEVAAWRKCNSCEQTMAVCRNTCRDNGEGYATNAAKGRARTNHESYSAGGAKARPKANVEATINAQMVLDQNAAEIASTMYNNLYLMEHWNGEKWVISQTGTVVCGRFVLTNAHLLNFAHAFPQMRLKNHTGSYLFDATKVRTVICENDPTYGTRDVCIIEMPRHFPQHRDIRKFLVKKEDYAYFNSVEWVALLGFAPNNQNIFLRQYYSNVCEAVDCEFPLRDSMRSVLVRQFFRYGIQTQRGDCGSLMILFDKNRTRKIAGIHMAGENNPKFQGVAQAIHYELIQSLLDQIDPKFADSSISLEVPVDTEVTLKNIPLTETESRLEFGGTVQGNFLQFGTMAVPVHKNVKTRIQPSPVYGKIAQPTMKPAFLRPFVRDGVRYDPLELARVKASTPAVKLDDEILDECAQHVSTLVTTRKKPGDDKVLTLEQAIAGIEGDEFIQGVSRKTSPGYGWSKSGVGKHQYLSNADGSWRCDHPEVLKACDSVRMSCAQGGRPATFWTDTLKDERRPIEKVNQGKTRLFSAGEMAFSIVFRQFFLPFIAHMMRNRIDFESTVGINCYSYEWTMLAVRLSQVGPHVIAGDFSNYDGTLAAEILWKCLDIVEDFYEDATDEERTIRRGLWSEIVHSVHIDGNTVYGWTHSQPSGCPMTTILNCLYHSIAFRYVYILCAEKYCPDRISLDNFNRFVRHNNYGDDDVTNISSEIIEWFNQETITEAFLKLGMVYTDEAKTGEIVKYRSLKDVAFLKRAFRWDSKQCRYRAPLSLGTIREMAMWNHGSVDVEEQTVTTLEEAVHELAQHDEQVFMAEIPAFKRAAKVLTRPVYFSTYDYYQRVETARWAQSGVCDRGSSKMSERELAANPATHLRSEGYLPYMAVDRTLNNRVSARSMSRKIKSSARKNFRLNKMIDFNAQSGAETTDGESQGTLDLAPAIHLDTQQVTTLVEEGPAPIVGDNSRILHQYYADADDDLANDLRGFLERLVPLKTGTWASNTGLITSLATIDLPVEWMKDPMINEKLRGFRYFRCDFVVKLQVNAQPFNAGRLMLVFNPFEKQLQLAPSNFIHFGGLTGYRHVDLDIAESTAVELRIPFLTTASHFDLVTAAQCILGTVHAVVYSPLTGSDDVDYIMWVRAENVDFQMPTGLPISGSLSAGPKLDTVDYNAQSGIDAPIRRVKQSGKQKTPTSKSFNSNKEDVTPAPKIKTRIDSEKARPGTIESMSRTVGRVARTFLAVPSVGMYARALSWMADAVGATANLFGWSKPTDPEFSTSVSYQLGKNFANFNGDAKTKVMAMDFRNENDIPTEIFGTDEDEMAISTIVRRPTYIDRFQFSKTDLYNQVIWKWPVDATSCLKDKYSDPSPPAHYGIRRYNNLVSYMAAMFRYWRGSLCYHFKVVKTPFHSGRLRLVWVPGAVESTDPNTIDFNKCYSEVYDLRQTTSIDFCVPFTWNLPWKRSDDAPGRNDNIDKCWSDPTGMLYMVVVNSLRNPTTCADKIDIIVEESAGEDFQLAYPEIVYDNYRIWMRANLPTLLCNAQSNISSEENTNPSINALGMGEVVLSTRQVLKRYEKFPDVYDLPARLSDSTVNFAAEGAVHISPAATVWLSDASIGQNLASNNVSWFDLVASLYRFATGSTRLLSYFDKTANVGTAPGTYSWFNSTNDVSRDGFWAIVGNSNPDQGTNTPYAIQFTQFEPYQELNIPFYSPFPVNLGPMGRPENHIAPTSMKMSNGAFPQVSVHVQAESPIHFRRSIGEDFSFGYLVGPPVTAVMTTA